MINLEQAKAIAKSKLEEIQSKTNYELMLLEDQILSFEFGWVFFYQSADYIATGNQVSMLGGNAPFLVDKYDGNVFLTGTRKDIHEYINIFTEFKKAWLS
ncbi:MAG: YrhB domain-containing protein [Ferruginibacter sp.]